MPARSGVGGKPDLNLNLKNVDVLAVVVAAAAVAVAAVAVDDVAVVVAVVADVERLVHYQDLELTEEISSTDETLFLLLHLRGVAGIWSSACCIALPALQEVSRAGRDGPEK
jgi:hypothetical protein